MKFFILLVGSIFIFGCATTNPPVIPAGSTSASASSSKLTSDGNEDIRLENATMDKEGIRGAIINDRRGIRSCYDSAVKHDKNTKGKIEISWSIGDTGNVNRSSVWSNSTGDEELAQCVRKRLARLKFPMPPKGEVARVTYPFIFEPSGELAK